MKTYENEPLHDDKSPAATEHESQAIPSGDKQAILADPRSRVVFFGPSFSTWQRSWEDNMSKLPPEERRKQDFGEKVSRDEIKDMAVAYADQVKAFTTLDPNKEPMVLRINKWEIEELIKDSRCVELKAVLAVEVNPKNNARHVTFVLMPCGGDGRVIIQGADPGRERWNFGRNVQSIIRTGNTEREVEVFFRDDLRI